MRARVAVWRAEEELRSALVVRHQRSSDEKPALKLRPYHGWIRAKPVVMIIMVLVDDGGHALVFQRLGSLVRVARPHVALSRAAGRCRPSLQGSEARWLRRGGCAGTGC